MPGIRVDRLLASTAIALLLALPSTGTFAGSENGPAADASATPPQESQADNANKPAAASDTTPAPAAAPAGQAAQSAGGEAKPDAKPSPSTDAAQPGEGAKSAAEGKPAETKPADAKPSDTAVTNAPATASPEAAPATAAAPVAPGPDAAIAEQLRELGNGKFDRIIGSKKDRTQIEAFYSSRNYAPLWIADGKPNARATAAIGYLRHVDADGLDPADYPVPNFAVLGTPADLADAEIKLTNAVVTYAHHASVGQVHWSRVSSDIEYSTPPAEPGDVLAAI
ncbi:MAG TPA: murein L,D-transpeptidase, partial [Xanthobacteraceae bacterium]